MNQEARAVLLITRRAILRLFLTFAAIIWGMCVAGIFAPAPVAFNLLEYIGGMDASPLLANPIYDYWLRMASGAFALIGAGYAALALWPQRFAGALPLAGAFMILEGLVLLTHGLRLGLPPSPFWADTAACLVGGLGIFLCMGSVRRQ